MATSKQEKIYNEIVKYYDFTDKLIDVIEDGKDNVRSDQLEIVEGIVENLEKYTDQLTTQFIEFVKEGNSEENTQNIRDALNGIIFEVEKYKSRIYKLYNKQESDTI